MKWVCSLLEYSLIYQTTKFVALTYKSHSHYSFFFSKTMHKPTVLPPKGLMISFENLCVAYLVINAYSQIIKIWLFTIYQDSHGLVEEKLQKHFQWQLLNHCWWPGWPTPSGHLCILKYWNLDHFLTISLFCGLCVSSSYRKKRGKKKNFWSFIYCQDSKKPWRNAELMQSKGCATF